MAPRETFKRRLTESQARAELAKRCDDAGGQKAWADRHGISAAYVCDAIQGRRALGRKLLEAMGLRYIAMYEMDYEGHLR